MLGGMRLCFLASTAQQKVSSSYLHSYRQCTGMQLKVVHDVAYVQ